MLSVEPMVERNVLLKSISAVRDANPRNAPENTAMAQARWSESILGKCTPGDVVSIRWKALVAFPLDGPQRERANGARTLMDLLFRWFKVVLRVDRDGSGNTQWLLMGMMRRV